MKTCVVRRRFLPSGATGNIADTIYTPPGFGIPKFAICYYTNGSDNDTYDESTANRVFGIGFIGLSAADNSTIVAFTSILGFQHNETQSSANNKSVSGNSPTRFAFEIRVSDRSVLRQFTSPVFGQDKLDFTYQNTNATTSPLDFVFIFFTGSDIQANIGTLPLNTAAAGTSSVTGLTFRPDAILTSGTGYSFNASGVDGRLSFGCSTRSGIIKNSALAFRMRNSAGNGTTVSEAFYDDNCFAMYTINNNAISRAHVTAFESDGFTITSRDAFQFGTAASTSQIVYMAIKGPASNIFDLKNFTSSTSTGISGIATTDFIPSLVIGALGTLTTVTTGTPLISNDSTGLSFFAAKSLTNKSNYGLGTMSVTSGLTAVTGAGTAFSSLNPGDIIYNSVNALIGTVSSFSTNTSMTLASGATATMSAEKYSVIPFGQFSVSIGASVSIPAGVATTTKVYSAINTNPFFVASYGTSATPTTLVKAKVNNFDSYPGFKLNYDTANATARKGWVLAFKDNENRRRDGN
jgi:hypothetical protein